ncbi:hypothetical protein GOBAR_DD13222 [Gossypium barbadense]|nr:hypothetical protein GOBAR_DD13222 [Gossypium barbadense]
MSILQGCRRSFLQYTDLTLVARCDSCHTASYISISYFEKNAFQTYESHSRKAFGTLPGRWSVLEGIFSGAVDCDTSVIWSGAWGAGVRPAGAALAVRGRRLLEKAALRSSSSDDLRCSGTPAKGAPCGHMRVDRRERSFSEDEQIFNCAWHLGMGHLRT